MAKTPLVSVVIPVWNTGKAVQTLLNSLLKQSYKNIEIIAVDDGSTDDSLKLLNKVAKSQETVGRIKIIHQENAGASAARNTGLDAAHGKYVILVDSDDDVTEDFVEKLVSAIEASSDIALASTGKRYNKLLEGKTDDTYMTPHHKRRKSERMADYLLTLLLRDGRMYGVTNKIFRMDTIRKLDLRFEEGRNFAEDTKFVLDYLEYTPGEIEFILEPLYIYNFGTETSTVKTSSTVWANWEKSYDDLENWAKNVSDGKLHLKTKFLLKLVRLRWRVSHYRSKKRAKSAAKN